jgi:V8-like Glu-specific endopeptidase
MNISASTRIKIQSLSIVLGILCAGTVPTAVRAAAEHVLQHNGMTALILPEQQSMADGALDYENAQPQPLPMVTTPPDASPEARELLDNLGPAGSVRGRRGNGIETPVRLIPRERLQRKSSGSNPERIAPQGYGTSNHPFTTSRVDVASNKISKLYPYRAAGKLFFKKADGGTYICSAALIKKGLVVTAAHCVADFGRNRFYNSWEFIPAYYDGLAPYGKWAVKSVRVLTSYLNGTDLCAATAPGVVCKNDIAVMSLRPQRGRYAGHSTGYYGYGWNGYGFTGPGGAAGQIALINQLGYPRSHDGGHRMQRTDAQGYISGASTINNTIWGTRQTEGASGGPEVVNLGVAAVLSDGIGYGAEEGFNRIIGVTSWGYTDGGLRKEQGASPFLSTNIVRLINAECARDNPAC